jgi:hypothetical protein
MKNIAPPKDDLRERFILFLASKPADLGYNWSSMCDCACGTFIREELHEFVEPNYGGICSESHRVWYRWNRVAEMKPHTYGALLKRVRDHTEG